MSLTVRELAHMSGLGDSLRVGPQWIPPATHGVPIISRGPHGKPLAPPLDDRLQWWSENLYQPTMWRPGQAIVGVMGLGGALQDAASMLTFGLIPPSQPSSDEVLGRQVTAQQSAMSNVDFKLSGVRALIASAKQQADLCNLDAARASLGQASSRLAPLNATDSAAFQQGAGELSAASAYVNRQRTPAQCAQGRSSLDARTSAATSANQCANAGGTWVNGQCSMPMSPTSKVVLGLLAFGAITTMLGASTGVGAGLYRRISGVRNPRGRRQRRRR